jgi:hypothetical protein
MGRFAKQKQPTILTSTMLPGLMWPAMGERRSGQEENKNHREKIFKCLFIILSSPFELNSIYGNDPLNEAI